MTGIIFHLTKIEGSMQASANISRWLEKETGFGLIDDLSICPKVKAYDYVLMVNSPTAFTDPKFIFKIIEFIKICKYPVFVNNDYILTQASQMTRDMKPKKFIYWSSCPERKGKNILANFYINWNLLSYNPHAVKIQKINKFIYWGALRPGRKEDFAKYLNHEKISISTNKRGEKLFSELCPNSKILPKFINLIPSISRYTASIYLEDSYSHRHFCSPANRFYESLSAGIAIYFEKNCIGTFEKAGYDIRPYVFSSQKELIDKLKNSGKHAVEQAAWKRNYQLDLKKQYIKALSQTEKLKV